MQRLGKFFRLPSKKRWLALEALFWLGLARLAVKTLRFKRLMRWLGEKDRETARQDLPAAQAETVRQVAEAIRRVKRYTPWDSNCLAQAITARQMLGRRGVPTTVYLGAALDAKEGMVAHAWVRSGNWIVTGMEGMRRYGVVGRFAQPAERETV